MATHIEVGLAGSDLGRGVAPVEKKLLAYQAITPDGTNKLTSFTLPSNALRLNGSYFVTITPDENVFIAIGTAPDATATPKRAMTAGFPRSFEFGDTDQVAVTIR